LVEVLALTVSGAKSPLGTSLEKRPFLGSFGHRSNVVAKTFSACRADFFGNISIAS
jgi:hypothetical protein